MKKVVLKIKEIFAELKQEKNKNTYHPSYRVIEIIKSQEDEYTIHVQLIGKSLTFYAKPEEILADDKLVDEFSPRDIRTLTYLGYLGINAPKYKILAKRFLDNNEVAFAIKKRGEKEVILKTASEILGEREILISMNAEDAKTVGYMVATKKTQDERIEKMKLIGNTEK